MFSKYRSYSEKEVCFVDYPRAKQFFCDYNEAQMVYHASAMDSVKKIRNSRSVISVFKFKERIRILIQAISGYRENNYSKEFGYYLDYLFLEKFLLNQRFEHVVTCETINRYAYWIGELQHKIGGVFEIIPHGTLIGTKEINLPNKIWIDRIRVWNDVEKDLFAVGVSRNNSCGYYISEYRPSVKFEHYGKEKRIKVGIFSQMDVERYYEIAQNEKIDSDKYLFIIMPHPLEKPCYDVEKFANIKISNCIKYIDIDVALTGNSTIIYDLIYSGYKKKIIVYSDKTNYSKVTNHIVFAQNRECVINELLNCRKE